MTDRDQILDTLRSKERTVTHPPAWRSRRYFDDLSARFDSALTSVAGEVVRASSLPAALDQLDALISELALSRIAVNADAPFDAMTARDRWPHVIWRWPDGDPDDLRAFCAVADAGITGADAALAETGSLLVTSGPGKSRLVPLLPPVHIALAPTSRLTTDLFTWTADRGGDVPSNLTLITGPSKTADIEQTLAIGVHGPKRFIVILYDD